MSLFTLHTVILGFKLSESDKAGLKSTLEALPHVTCPSNSAARRKLPYVVWPSSARAAPRFARAPHLCGVGRVL